MPRSLRMSQVKSSSGPVCHCITLLSDTLFEHVPAGFLQQSPASNFKVFHMRLGHVSLLFLPCSPATNASYYPRLVQCVRFVPEHYEISLNPPLVAIFPLIQRGPNRKRHAQHLLYCCVCIHCRGKVFTELLPSNDYEGETHRLMGEIYEMRC
jgi:hypothetical protein